MLRGQKVILREKRIADAPKDYAWRSDPELARFDGVAPLNASFSEYMAICADELRYPDPQRRRFAIESDSGKHIGNCMYYDIDMESRQAELGIMIGGRDYWGKGYGTDAVTTLLRHIFQTTKLERVYLYTLDWNIRAQRCFEKCGFVPCGRLTKDGQTFIAMEIRRSWVKEAGVMAGTDSEFEKKEGIE